MASHPLDETRWRLTAYRHDGALRSLPEDVEEVTLEFDGPHVAGNSGCNRYMAQVVVDRDTLSFSAVAGTRMLCPPQHMELERAYLSALEASSVWERRDATMELRDPAGATTLVFALVVGISPGVAGTE